MQDAFTEVAPSGGASGMTARGRDPSWTVASLLGLLITAFSSCLTAEAATAEPSAKIRELRSRHVRLYTDLGPSRARDHLNRMEQVLRRTQKYWARPVPGMIEVYLVDRLDQWPPDRFPLAEAAVVLQHIGGGTAVQHARAGRNEGRQTCVFATTRTGVLEHEMVHAYCFQTFGRAGPDWYREGMAEVLRVPPKHAARCVAPKPVICWKWLKTCP